MKAGTKGIVAAGVVGAALVAGPIAVQGVEEEAIRVGIRATARLAFAILLVAFVASSLARRFPSKATRGLLVNRRAVGLSFAAVQFMHAVAFLSLIVLFDPEIDIGTQIGGGIGYAFVIAMAATSSDRAVAKLGVWWRRLHRTGIWVLFVIFAFTYAGVALDRPGPLPILFTLAWIAALALRLWPHPRTAGEPA